MKKDDFGSNAMDRALIFVVVGMCLVIALFSFNPMQNVPPITVFDEIVKTDPAVNPGRAAGEILETALPKLIPPNASYGFYGRSDGTIFTLWGYWQRNGCVRKHIIIQVDTITVSLQNYQAVAATIIGAAAKFVAMQQRKKEAQTVVVFENLPERQKRVANALWEIGAHMGTHAADAGMALFVTLASRHGKPIVSWCLVTREHQERAELVAIFALPKLETLREETRRDVINKKIFTAYEKIQDAIKRSVPKQSA